MYSVPRMQTPKGAGFIADKLMNQCAVDADRGPLLGDRPR